MTDVNEEESSTDLDVARERQGRRAGFENRVAIKVDPLQLPVLVSRFAKTRTNDVAL